MHYYGVTGEGFLCPWHLSLISGKRGYTLNFHYKIQQFILFSASGGFAPDPPHYRLALCARHMAPLFKLLDPPVSAGADVNLRRMQLQRQMLRYSKQIVKHVQETYKFERLELHQQTTCLCSLLLVNRVRQPVK